MKQMAVRQRCNRVMGCEPAVALAQLGAAAVPAIVDVVRDNPRTDGWWLIKLVDLLGQLDDDRALPLLHELLSDDRLDVRARAAVSLGRLGRKASVEPLRAALAKLEPGAQPGFEAALLVALDRTSGTDPARRDRVAALLPGDQEALGRIPPPRLALLVEVAHDAHIAQALPGLRIAARHRARPIRLEAVKALGTLRDTGGIPVLVGRLDDPLPSVQRAVIASLQQITGNDRATTPAQWRAWCERRRCLGEDDPAAAPDASGRQVPDGG